MIRVSDKVGSGDARLGLSVRAKSIRQATSIAQTLNFGAQTRVIFHIEPETFFVIDSAATVGPVEREESERIAGQAICQMKAEEHRLQGNQGKGGR